MVWGTGSTQTSSPQVQILRTRLLLSYLGVLIATLAAFAGLVYEFVAHNRNQQLNDYLQQAGRSAAQTLEIVKHEREELQQDRAYRGYAPKEADGRVIPLTLSQLMGKYKAKSVLAAPASPRLHHQGIEWYDENQRLLIQEGELFPAQGLPSRIKPAGLITQQGTIRSFVLPVYRPDARGDRQLLGYIRANESLVELNAELRRLQWGLAIGGMFTLGLTTIGSIWLTRESLKPIVKSLEQLRQFTADASHELRTPLTAIRASVAVLESHPERVHPADVGKIAGIASASKQMTRLVDDLLLLTRMDSQPANAQEWRSLPLDELLEDLLEMADSRAQQQGLTLKANLLPDVAVNGDAGQLQRLFTNLVFNALQYTPAGGTIAVSMQRSANQVLVQVEDTGIGLAPEHLPLIFDRFWQANPVRANEQSGAGLGLAIAKAIAQRHHGDISVRSQLGKGSCFQVRLPTIG